MPYVVHGAEAAWSDVASWVSDRWHNLLSIGASVATVTFSDVQNIVDVAIHTEQTAWASFVSTLESWINVTTSFLEDAINAAEGFTLSVAIDVWMELQTDVQALFNAIVGEVYGIDQALARQWWDTVQAIDNAEANLKSWAIDNIYNPLLQDVWRAIELEQTDIANVERWFQTELDNLNLRELPGILAKLGVIAAAITAVQSWVDDCGEPMCEQMGPKTDWSKLLKVLNVAGMLALLTSVGALTEPQLEQLAATVAQLGADPAAAFVDAFVTEGDTLATAIADTVPALAL
ncbi:MAG TPA: hypothetical protein VFO15_18025 [Xanthobacteraceae bacterium]|nr:hypothetical protein [Xanthobacteraceae bacterium]